MRKKPRDASEHHGAFGRMRLHYDGLLTTGNGSRLHRFEFRSMWHRWPRTALGKIRTLMAEAGYEAGETRERIDNAGNVHDRTYVFLRGEDEVRVFAYGTSTYEKEERVHRVEHFPNGTKGDDRRPGITINQVISAMSWGH